MRENDKIVTINAKTPRNVDDAVAVIKAAGNQIKLVVLREEDVPDIQLEDGQGHQHSLNESGDGQWASQSFDLVRAFFSLPCV